MTEPQIKAGSLLLVVGSVIHGLRPGALLDGEQRLVELDEGGGVIPITPFVFCGESLMKYTGAWN